MPRFLRPAHLVCSGDAVWLVDESWPAAAAIDADGAARVVQWPPSGTASYSEPDRIAVADGVGIVVQDGRQVAWVRRAGSTAEVIESGLTLSAADPETAWLVDRTYVDPHRAGHDSDASEPPPLPTGRIVALHRDGSRTTVTTQAPVQLIELEDSDVVVTLSQRPIRHRRSSGSGYRIPWEYPTSKVRVGRQDLFAHGLAHAVSLAEDVARANDSAIGWRWLETDPRLIRRYGVTAGGLLWWAGAETKAGRADRRVIAVGHDPTTTREVLRIDLGLGLGGSARTVGDELWLTVARRRLLSFAPRDRGVDVLAVSPRGTVRTIYRADSIAITSSAPPLRRPTNEQIDDHAQRVRNMFASLNDFWETSDGTKRPLSRGLTDPSVTVVGEWPETRVVVALRHRSRPGLLLRRTLPLFDDVGQPVDYQDADMYFMEDLDTNHLTPADEAVEGVLDT